MSNPVGVCVRICVCLFTRDAALHACMHVGS